MKRRKEIPLLSLLKRWDRKYFDGKLPTFEVVFAKPSQKNAHAETTWYPDGRIEIRLQPYLAAQGRLMAIVLLHEVIHVSLPKNAKHGLKFAAARRRLIRRGAYDSLL